MKTLSMSLLLFHLMVAPVFADVLIISHPGVADTVLSKSDVREIFMGKQVQWSDHSKIHVFVTDDPEVHREFLSTYLNRSPSYFNSHWKRMLFSGKGKPPKSFRTVGELVEMVSKIPGAIGYADGDTTAANINIVKVE